MVGYYLYSLNLERARIDPPMTRIHFTADTTLGHCSLEGSGIDSVGNFTLSGSVHENGIVAMTRLMLEGFRGIGARRCRRLALWTPGAEGAHPMITCGSGRRSGLKWQT
jgi:hypothetical protein